MLAGAYIFSVCATTSALLGWIPEEANLGTCEAERFAHRPQAMPILCVPVRSDINVKNGMICLILVPACNTISHIHFQPRLSRQVRCKLAQAQLNEAL